MQLKHVVINETNGGPENSLDKHPALLVWSSWVCGTGMGFLYSMVSHCCFQQTVHHYSIWQESKHCAFKGQEKARPPSLCQVPSSCILMLLCFLSHFHTPPCIPLLFHRLCSFLFSHQQHHRVDVYLTHFVTMQVFQLLGWRQIFVSMGSSLQSGRVWRDFCFPKLAQKECSMFVFYNLFKWL